MDADQFRAKKRRSICNAEVRGKVGAWEGAASSATVGSFVLSAVYSRFYYRDVAIAQWWFAVLTLTLVPQQRPF